MRAWAMWAWYHISYLLRPYDMLADRRRWLWQPRQQCGFWGGELAPDRIVRLCREEQPRCCSKHIAPGEGPGWCINADADGGESCCGECPDRDGWS